MKIHRVHFIQSVYVGPVEPYDIIPPLEAMENNERAKEWSVTEGNGGVTITHSNPRTLTRKVDGKDVPTPHGQTFATFVPNANIRGIQYEPSDIAAPKPAKVAA